MQSVILRAVTPHHQLIIVSIRVLTFTPHHPNRDGKRHTFAAQGSSGSSTR